MVTLICRALFSLLGRFGQSLTSEPTDSLCPSQKCPSPTTPESTLSSVPSESPDTFSNLHLSVAPETISQSPPGSPPRSIYNPSSVGSSPTMADKKRRAPQPPLHPIHETQPEGNHVPVREISNPGYVEADGSQQDKKYSLPLPDYETLFPKKRHGVQGQTRWDHIIAQVNQRHRDTPELLGPEMSVDGPEEHEPNHRTSSPQEKHYQTQLLEAKPASSKKVAAPAPPKPAASLQPRSVADPGQIQSQNMAQTHQSLMRPNPSAAMGPQNTDTSSGRSLPGVSRDGARKVLQPSPIATNAPRATSQMDQDTAPTDDQRQVPVSMNKDAPIAKPRQRVSGKEPAEQDFVVTPVLSNKNMNSNSQTSSRSSMSNTNKTGVKAEENFVEFDPFPNTELLSKDPWAQLSQNQEADNLFTGSVQKEQKPEDRGLTPGDLDEIFSQVKPTDPFTGFNGSNSNKQNEYRTKEEDSKQFSPAFQRKNSQKRKQMLPSITHLEKGSKSRQEPAYQEETADKGRPARDVANEFISPKHQADVKTQSSFHGREDPFGAEAFSVPSALTSSETLQVAMEEPASQAGVLSGGKTLLRAWVSPSDVQPVSAQNSNGGGLALTPRR